MNSRHSTKSSWLLGAVALVLAFGAGRAPAEGEFARCVAQLGATARARGVSKGVAERVLASVRERPEVVARDDHQPEFVETFAAYLRSHVTAARVARGRELLERHRKVLARLEAQYGVPPQYLVAFWGLETDYGRVLGEMPVFDSLATLACDTRRAEYFAGEFVKALEIVDRGDVAPATMTGSWAGAMGNTQFMPSVYLKEAVDGDGDGRVDIWGSVPDALASAANFLRSLGWTPGWRWGREVLLPKSFDYFRAGLDRSETLASWRKADVRSVDGRLVPAVDATASLLLPAGRRGPAFLVYPNFRTIMRWNRSELFALAVGRLADRIAGAGALHSPPPDDPRVPRADIEKLQRKLDALGLDSGEPDGIAGAATRRAVRKWQHAHGLAADGYVDPELLQSLGIE